MSFIRVFHPIGQGGFYTEQHYDQDETLNVVYDCGSVTGPKAQFLRKVATALPADSIIDLLFISHFHDDHINGINELKKRYSIRTVVLPKLTEQARTLLKLENYLKYGRSHATLIDFPQRFFGKKTLVIQVEPVQGASDEATAVIAEGNNGPFIDITPEGEPTFSSNLGSAKQHTPRSVPSGTVLRFQTAGRPFWEYIPFNYDFVSRGAAFLASLAGLGIQPDSLENIANVVARKKDLTAAYRKLKGGLNPNTLVVYSGAVGPAKRLINHSPGINLHYFCHHHSQAEGCLYLGDIDLNVGTCVTDIQVRLQNFWQKIYSVQVPHHGAIGNFNLGVFNPGAQAIISFGTTNTYGHPSAHVISQLYQSHARPVLVTEKQETGFYSLD